MIRKAEPDDIQDILIIYQAARDYMRKSGNESQWGDHYPPVDLLEADIKKGQLYVIVDGDALHGVFAFILGEDPTYNTIECGSWKNHNPYGTIHRVASDGTVKGIFEQCFRFCKTQSDNIRIDTHKDNKAMRCLIERHGFERCGIIHVEDGSARIAYQYTEQTSQKRC